jgi:hypothetical protein
MASTIGGFLTGVGLTLILLASGALYAVTAFYTPVYEELLSYKPTIQEFYTAMLSPAMNRTLQIYRGLAELEPRIEGLAESYSGIYPKVIQLRDDVERFYHFTHSDAYRQVLDALRSLSAVIRNPIVSGALHLLRLGYVIPLIEQAPRLLEEAHDWSEAASEALQTIQLFPPGRVKAYVSSIRLLLQVLPPEKLEGFMAQARVGGERALGALEKVESYSPSALASYSVLILTLGTAQLTLGTFLIVRARKAEDGRRSIRMQQAQF